MGLRDLDGSLFSCSLSISLVSFSVVSSSIFLWMAVSLPDIKSCIIKSVPVVSLGILCHVPAAVGHKLLVARISPLLLGLRFPCLVFLRYDILFAITTVDRNKKVQISTSTAIIMKQISTRDLLSSHVSFVIVLLGLLVFLGPPVAETALLAGEDVEFWAVVEDKDCRVLVCIAKVVVLLLKLMLRGEFVLASVMFWLPLRFWLIGFQVSFITLG